MAVSAGVGYVDIEAKFDNLNQKVSQQVSRAVGSAQGKTDAAAGKLGRKAGAKLGKGFSSAAKIGFAAAGTTLLALGKKSIDAFGESQKVAAQTEAVLRSTGAAAGVSGDHIADLAERLKRLSGIEDETIQAGQNMLLTFTGIRNEVGEGNDVFDQATKTLIDMSVALGTNPKNAAIQLGKALNDPIKGVSALQRVGVTFTDQQKKTIKSLVDGGRAADAQKIILAELNREFGGSAEAAGKARTPVEKLNQRMGDLQETVGGKLVGALDFLTRNMKILGPIITGITAGIVAYKVAVVAASIATIYLGEVAGKAWLKAAGPIGLAAAAIGTIIFLVVKFRKEIVGAFLAVGRTIKSVFTTAANFVIRNFVNKVIDGINLVIRGLNIIKPGRDIKYLERIAELRTTPQIAPGLGEFGHFAHGGVVPGPIGQPQLAVVHGGEEVLTAEQRKAVGGAVYEININADTIIGSSKKEIAEALGPYIRDALLKMKSRTGTLGIA